MALKVYNSATRRKEIFQTLQTGKVYMYVCGPTVYDQAHVGHAMSALVFDIIRRYLEKQGYQVIHVMNYTDVDDKIIQRAAQQGIDPFELADRYIREFDNHLQDFNVLPAVVNPRATQDMPDIIQMISGLVDKNFAYAVDGDVFFRVNKFNNYGKLSGRKIDEMQAGARIEVDNRKEQPMDFALWKAAKPGEPAWQSPWGMGRPGWHIECSAMNLKHLGEQIDIHGGGNDLIFPHHENEIAQSESYTGKTFARYWIHNGMLQLAGEKMSKSIGNLIPVKDFLANNEPDVLRLLVLNSSYRSPLSFSDEILDQTKRSLERLRSGLRPALSKSDLSSDQQKEALEKQMEATTSGFYNSMDDDFNTAGAMGFIFELVKTINLSRDSGMDSTILMPAQELLRELTGILGLQLDRDTISSSRADAFIELLIDVRDETRAQKLWSLSDKIRDRLDDLGVILEDGKEGTIWRWK